MSKPMEALRRLGVAGLATATIGAGLTAFAASPALAAVPAANSGIKTVTLSPTAPTALSTQAETANNNGQGGNAGCQLYQVNALNSNGDPVSGTVQINVILTPSAGVDSEFCWIYPRDIAPTFVTATNADNEGAGNPGQPDQAYATFDFSSGAAYIGVNEATADSGANTTGTATAGSIGITAYSDNNGNNQVDSGEPKATGTVNIVASPAGAADGQNEIVDTLQVTPPTTTVTEGDSATYTVTALHGTSLVAGADVRYQVKSSQGNVVGDVNGEPCDEPGYTANGGADDGTVECTVDAPATVTGTNPQSGPYTVTFYVVHTSCAAGSQAPVTGCDPMTTATLNTAPVAAQGSDVSLFCGTADSNHYSPTICNEPGTARTETLTAKVTKPGATAGSTVPEPGVLVSFDGYGYNYDVDAEYDPTFDPATCLTGADGTCTTTLHRDADDTDTSAGCNNGGYEGDCGTQYYVYAWIVADDGDGTTTAYSNNSSYWDADCDCNEYQDGNVLVDFENTFISPATNLTTIPAHADVTTDQRPTITAQATNQYDNPATTGTFDYYCCIGEPVARPAVSQGGPPPVIDSPYSVTFTITGVGRFTDGTTQQTVQAGPNGRAQVAVTSSVAGQSTVTATLDPNETDCSVPAATSSNAANDLDFYDPTARAGNCSSSSTITWTKGTGTVDRTRPHIDIPAVKDVQTGAHHHKIAGTAAPGHTLRLFKNGDAKGKITVGTNGRFSFDPNVSRRTTFYVKDLDNGLTSNTVTIYVKVSVSLNCTSPKDGKLVCHLDTDPTLKHAAVDYTITGPGPDITRSGETNRHGNDKLVLINLSKGKYTVKALVHGKHHVRHGTATDKQRVG